MAHDSPVQVVFYDAKRIPDDRPGAGEVPRRIFDLVRDDIVAACRKHGLVGPDDVKPYQNGECLYWVVDDQYNDERYQYVEVNGADGFSTAWLNDMTAALGKHPRWGLGVLSVPPGYVLIFEDRLLVTVAVFQGCTTVEEVVARAKRQIELDELVRASHDDASLERLSRAPGMDRAPVERINLAKVTDAGLVYLTRLSGLQGVNLGGAPITDAGLVHLGGLTGLHDLELFNTHITDAGLIHVRRLPGLKSLGLGGCRISDHGLARLRSLKVLEALYLVGTDVTDAGLAHLRAFANLKTLCLSRCRIGDPGLQRLRGLDRLETLELDGTGVTDKGIILLASLTSLKYLLLRETGVTGQGVGRLQRALPNCRILCDKQ